MSIVIIGDSHVARLRARFNFEGAKMVGVSGLTSNLLSQYMYTMMLHDIVVIMCGGNDVCDNYCSGRCAVTKEKVIQNLTG